MRRGKRKKKKPIIPKFAQNQFGEYVCYFDGSCEPDNPGGNMGVGAVILKEDNPIFEKSDYIPAKYENSNNVAEYMAFIHILDYLIDNDLCKSRIVVYGDSMLVVQQMNGNWWIKEGRYVQWAQKAKAKLAGFTNISIYWIPREDNQIADDLSKKSMIDNGCEFKIQPL